uniref:DNA helicase n=1 Tax=Mycena chlorophos TaxID=658473 RepID=A0ABQ0L1P1_MYCCL|nr:predicted protein [Mycena chlorophos]
MSTSSCLGIYTSFRRSAAFDRLCSSRTRQATVGSLYEQFTTVVTLTEQRRVTDEGWMKMLRRLRVGECTEDDISMLRSLLVDQERDEAIDWSRPPWDSAVLVTPRHSARVEWNRKSLRKHSAKTGECIYISASEDVVSKMGRELTISERLQAAQLGDEVLLSVGMRAMVLLNISTEAELANGTRGEIVDIVLDIRKPLPLKEGKESSAIQLKFPPAYSRWTTAAFRLSRGGAKASFQSSPARQNSAYLAVQAR